MIEIYPSTLPGEPIERHDVHGLTLHQWMTNNVPGYQYGPQQPVSATVSGEVVPPEQWSSLLITDKTTVELRIQPADGGLIIAAVVGVLLSAASMLLMKPKLQNQQHGQQGNRIPGADVEANRPKLGSVIPEHAGRHRLFPDYLCQPRKYYIDEQTQAVDVMMCVGRGEFLIPDDEIRIGKTPVSTLGESFNYQTFGPGEDVTTHEGHRNWYNAPEVGASTGSTGLRLRGGDPATKEATSNLFQINGNSITIPQSAGIAPADWEVGGIVEIAEFTREFEVVDGGWAFPPAPLLDKVRGDFTGTGLAVGTVFYIQGAQENNGQYRVKTYTETVNEPGSSSIITGVKSAPLEYLLSPISFSVGSSGIALDKNYADHDELVIEINIQLAGYSASHNSGVITITELPPFSGQNISLSGYYEPVFGAAPTSSSGAETKSYSEMTLDIFLDGRWQPATALVPGVFTGCAIYEQDLVYTGGFTPGEGFNYERRFPRFEIQSIIFDGAETIGWTFQRILPDGTHDESWTGFWRDEDTPDLRLTYDQTQLVGGWVGPFNACPPGETTYVIEWDVLASQGMGRIDDDGNIRFREREVEVQWRPAGSSAPWESIKKTVGGNTRNQLGWTFKQMLPSAITPEVRLRRIGIEDESTQSMDRLEWYGLKSQLPAAPSYPGVTTMAATLIGSDTISEQTENQISIVPTRILPVRSGGQWQPAQPTRDIAPWVAHVAHSIGYTDDQIDLDELDRLDAVWRARGDLFDHILGSAKTVRDAINQVLTAGFAEMTLDRGKIMPVRDELRTVFEHMYTPQNMTRPLRRTFTAPHPDDRDGVDVEYIDPETWTKATVACRLPGDQGRKVDKIKVDGVTDRTRAWRIGMRVRRAQKYRRWKYTFATELDALNSRYLSYCALGDDVPGYGQSAWIKSVESYGGAMAKLTVSEPLQWEDGQSHVLAWRKPDGTLAGPYTATPTTDGDEFAALVAMPPPWPVLDSKQEPPHVLFGTAERWTYPALITRINPQGMETVQVEGENYHPEVYADDDNSPPA